MRTPTDWGQPCPNPACVHAHRLQQGTVSAIATSLPPSGTRRLLRCHTGETPCSATRETVLFDLRTAEDPVMMARKRRLVRVALTGIGCVLGVTAETGLAWRRRAAPQAEGIHRPLLRELPVTQGHRDARWHGRARTHACETEAAGARVPAGEEGRQGIWLRVAPACRWRIAAMVGPRPRDTATEVGATTTARVAGGPACFSEGFTGALAARLAAFHGVPTGARPGKRGRPRTPRWAPHPALVSGPWVTQTPQGTLVTRSTRVGRGAARLPPLGLTSSTAVGERVPVTWRQAWAPLTRQTTSCWKDRERLRQRVVFFQAFSPVARPPMSWRQLLPLHEPHATVRCVPAGGSARQRWRQA